MATPKMSLAFLVVLFIALVSSEETKMDRAQELTLTNSINQFSAKFYKETAALKPGENLIMSPLSAEIVLALLSMGARSETLEELNTGLYLPNSEFTKSAFKPAIAKLNNVEGVTLKIANKVFVMDGEQFKLAPDFKKLAVEVFASEVQSVDFSASVHAASTINTWVENKTNDKIKDLISPTSLDASTRLVLVNAIYFKGNWDDPFQKSATSKKLFHLNSKETVEVDMMHQTSRLLFADLHEWNAKVLEMKYAKSDTSMFIILPNEIEGLKSVEEKLLTANLKKDVFDKLHSFEITLSLPKFKIETEIDMKKVLPKLGIKSIFGAADLSGLLENSEPLFVSEAIQKAFIEVNEEGAEAAAASFVKVVSYSMPIRREMNIDRPFYYFIIKAREYILFKGRVVTF